MKNWEQRHLAGQGSVVFSLQSQCRILEVREKFSSFQFSFYRTQVISFSPLSG